MATTSVSQPCSSLLSVPWKQIPLLSVLLASSLFCFYIWLCFLTLKHFCMQELHSEQQHFPFHFSLSIHMVKCDKSIKTNRWCISDVMAQCMLWSFDKNKRAGAMIILSASIQFMGKSLRSDIWYHWSSPVRTNDWPGGPVPYVLFMCASPCGSGWLGCVYRLIADARPK